MDNATRCPARETSLACDVDEKHLRAEINYAINEKIQRGEDFSIITLVTAGEDGKAGVVPELLEPYVWKQPSTQLQRLREILRALPPPFREIRPTVEVSAEPDVRVVVTAMRAAEMRPAGQASRVRDVIMVKLENHGDRPVFVGSGLSFTRRQGQPLLAGKDIVGALLVKRTLEPGNAPSLSRWRTLRSTGSI